MIPIDIISMAISAPLLKYYFVGVWELTFVAFGGLFFWIINPLYFQGP